MINVLKMRSISVPALVRLVLITMVLLPLFLLDLKDAQRNPLFPFNAHLMLGVYLVLFFVAAPFLRFKPDAPKVYILGGWTVLCLLALLTGFWGVHTELILQRSLMVFVPSLLLFTVVLSDREPLQTFCKIVWFISWFGVFLAFVGLLIYFAGEIVWVDGQQIGALRFGPLYLEQSIYGGVAPFYRISSLTGNPNTLAALLDNSLVATLALFLTGAMRRLQFSIFMAIQSLALVLTFSRNGVGVALLTLVLLYVLSAQRFSLRFVRTTLVCTLMTVLVMLFLQFAPPSITTGVEQRLSAGLNFRDEIWAPLLTSIVDKPLTGVGFGVSSEAILAIHNIELGAHNAHIGVLAEVGVIGYVILLIIWMYGIIIGLHFGQQKHLDHRVRIAVLTMGILLVGLFVHQTFSMGVLRFDARNFLWVYFVASVVALYCRYRPRKPMA